MKKLTPSQIHSILAGIVGVGAVIAQYAPAVEHALPDLKWIPGIVTVVALGVTMASRGLKTSTSGTGYGLIATGPDVKAAEAQAGGLIAATVADPVAPVDPAAQEIISAGMGIYETLKAEALAQTKSNLSAAALASAHAQIKAGDATTSTPPPPIPQDQAVAVVQKTAALPPVVSPMPTPPVINEPSPAPATAPITQGVLTPPTGTTLTGGPNV